MAKITFAGESLIVQKLGDKQILDVARFIFANVLGLDPQKPIDRSQAKPPASQIVYTYAIPPWNAGYVNPNQVVYSSMLGSDVELDGAGERRRSAVRGGLALHSLSAHVQLCK